MFRGKACERRRKGKQSDKFTVKRGSADDENASSETRPQIEHGTNRRKNQGDASESRACLEMRFSAKERAARVIGGQADDHRGNTHVA